MEGKVIYVLWCGLERGTAWNYNDGFGFEVQLMAFRGRFEG